MSSNFHKNQRECLMGVGKLRRYQVEYLRKKESQLIFSQEQTLCPS